MTDSSLHCQLSNARKNLRLVEEQKAKSVLETEAPLTLLREERRLRALG